MQLRTILHSKIHRATITQCDINYNGSISIDSCLLNQSDILPYEKVLVACIDNGQRFETYVIPATANSGVIGINGAAAKLVSTGMKVIIMAFSQVDYPDGIIEKPKVLSIKNDTNTDWVIL